MPTFNLTPILFPRAKKTDDLYDMLTDLIYIKRREKAIIEGGEIQNPASLDEFIQMYEDMEKDPSLSAGQRREATKSGLKLQQEQIKIWLDKKKQIDKSGIEWQLTQDLRDIEFTSPEDPWTYAILAASKIEDMLKGTDDREGLNDVLNTLQSYDVDTTTLEKYRNTLESDELEKFSRIDRAFKEAAGEETPAEKKEKALDSLEDYAILYTPLSGKAGRMEIIDANQFRREHMQKTNLKFSVIEGKLITVPSDQKGLPIYFIKANAATGDKYNFAGLEFDFTEGIGFRTENPERFDYQKIRHATIGDVKPKKFVEDNKGQLFYVNQDWTYSPVKNPRFLEELGYQEDKVYHLSPLERLNTLPGAIEHRIPLPILERWNSEDETAKFDYWKTLREKRRKEIRELTILEKIPPFVGRIEEKIPTLPSRIREFYRETMRKVEERKAKPKPIPEEPKWEAPEVPTSTELLKRGKEFIKKLGI